MINQTLLNILINRIRNGGINPATSEVMILEDIKIEEYRLEVERILNEG